VFFAYTVPLRWRGRWGERGGGQTKYLLPPGVLEKRKIEIIVKFSEIHLISIPKIKTVKKQKRSATYGLGLKVTLQANFLAAPHLGESPRGTNERFRFCFINTFENVC
jgi:hypothetical protein